MRGCIWVRGGSQSLGRCFALVCIMICVIGVLLFLRIGTCVDCFLECIIKIFDLFRSGCFLLPVGISAPLSHSCSLVLLSSRGPICRAIIVSVCLQVSLSRGLGTRVFLLSAGDLKRKERNSLQKGHVKDIGSTPCETILSLSPIPGGENNKLGSARD